VVRGGPVESIARRCGTKCPFVTSTRTIPREIEIIRLVVEGKSYKGITALLRMTVSHSLFYHAVMVYSIPLSVEGLGLKNDLANQRF
jgi:hypothetical protein